MNPCSHSSLAFSLSINMNDSTWTILVQRSLQPQRLVDPCCSPAPLTHLWHSSRTWLGCGAACAQSSSHNPTTSSTYCSVEHPHRSQTLPAPSAPAYLTCWSFWPTSRIRSLWLGSRDDVDYTWWKGRMEPEQRTEPQSPGRNLFGRWREAGTIRTATPTINTRRLHLLLRLVSAHRTVFTSELEFIACRSYIWYIRIKGNKYKMCITRRDFIWNQPEYRTCSNKAVYSQFC